MLSPLDKKDLDKAWQGTSDTVRNWLTDQRNAEGKGSELAELMLKAFVAEYRKTRSGVQAYRRLPQSLDQMTL